MQIGLANILTDMQEYINNSIREAMDSFASSFLNDRLIFSYMEEEYEDHVKWIMERIREAGHYLKPENWEFHNETVCYLWLIISRKEISLDEDKDETLRN